MNGDAGFFITLGAYAVPIIIVLAEIVAAIFLVHGFMELKHKKRKKKGIEFQNRNMQSVSQISGNEVQLLIARTDLAPVFVSDNFEKILGIPADKVNKDPERLGELMNEKLWKDFWKKYCNQWDGKEALQVDFVNEITKKWMRLEVSRSEDEKNDLFLVRDITRDKQEVLRLEEALTHAEEESKSKTTFLSRMSHEIRTPMNGIIGMLNLTHTQVAVNSKADEYLNKAESLSQHLLSLINDILDMSRIEAGKIELEYKEFDIFALADRLKTMFQANVEAKGVAFKVEMLDFDVRYLIGDELRLSQVLVNFISNSVKFTNEGEIVVTFRQMLRENGRIDLMVRVHDTGIGMEAEFINRIFHPFEQESLDISKKYGGSGLGMAITDQIVQLMGGQIVIDSMPDIGSDFTVYLNLPVASEQNLSTRPLPKMEDEAEEEFSYEGKRILMAEDNEINAEIAVEILHMYGAQVEVAENGQVAVDLFAANPPGYYDFILMDIQMPIMDGREAAMTIRSLDRPDAKTILIFALSADAFVEDKRKSAGVGMDGHFVKPVDFEEVRKNVGLIIRDKRRGNR